MTALVTAADSKYFLPLKNLVGSVKFHDNGTRILVYVRLPPRFSSVDDVRSLQL
jgi:hypothetical protein